MVVRAAPKAKASVRTGARLPAPGDVLGGRYRLEKIVGEGGSSVVWEACHVVMRRPVALKLLRSDDPNTARRFFREARVTAALRHANIVEVYDVFEIAASNTTAMVMELLVGAPLSRWLSDDHEWRHGWPVRETARVLLQVVAATVAAHSFGVVHRDLKPDNVFLLGNPASIDLLSPRIKVVDFGLAKLTASEGATAASGKLTRQGMVLGTPHYMSPEQVAGDLEVDSATDVWALGVIAYECLAGARPIDARSLTQMLRAIANPSIEPLSSRAPHVPRAVSNLVGAMLSKERGDRPTLRQVFDVLMHAAR
ncbi:Serine/threonine protein kinase PrkC, regulator of stationary phase [Labilithrix luteola]|uniref:Serine/threonine protein kinase PrkC, regulator of stationary phase n=1 Tax=Labilithrix luteola TaxID=1391654 RepID=A0A0K1PXG6_9BACT|nr:Serine/threonine protein kinase PrkC, regulator of stationary phase [Labilithrix luteola]